MTRRRASGQAMKPDATEGCGGGSYSPLCSVVCVCVYYCSTYVVVSFPLLCTADQLLQLPHSDHAESCIVCRKECLALRVLVCRKECLVLRVFEYGVAS